MSYQQIIHPGDPIPGAAAPMLGENVSSMFNRENLRSVQEFLGLGSGLAAWSVPTPANAKNNVNYFQLNYLLIAGVILALNFMFRTTFGEWIGLGVLGIAWFLFVRASSASAGTISVLGEHYPRISCLLPACVETNNFP